MQCRLDKWLLAYRNAPHAVTGISPANKFLGRALRTRLDLVYPARGNDSFTYAAGKVRDFQVGEDVWAREYMSGVMWKKGKIREVLGPLTYVVVVEGREWKRHVDQLRARQPEVSMPENGRSRMSSPNESQSRIAESLVSMPKDVGPNDLVPIVGNPTESTTCTIPGKSQSNTPITREADPTGQTERGALIAGDELAGGGCDNAHMRQNGNTPVPPEALRKSFRTRRAPKRLDL